MQHFSAKRYKFIVLGFLFAILLSVGCSFDGPEANCSFRIRANTGQKSASITNALESANAFAVRRGFVRQPAAVINGKVYGSNLGIFTYELPAEDKNRKLNLTIYSLPKANSISVNVFGHYNKSNQQMADTFYNDFRAEFKAKFGDENIFREDT